MAGVALLAGIIICGVLSFTALQVLNVLAGDGAPQIQEVSREEFARRTQAAAATATDEAIPTLRPVVAYNLSPINLDPNAPENQYDPLMTVIHGGFPLISDYCLLELGTSEERPCSETARMASTTGNIRDESVTLRLTLDKQNREEPGYRRAIFVLEFGDAPRGISLNIGDSRYADGDGTATVSNEDLFGAEMVIENGDLYIYGYNNSCTEQQSTILYVERDFVERGSRLYIEISDQKIRWVNETEGNTIESRCLFQLGGQDSGREAVDWDIYASFNRAVRASSGAGTGAGITRAQIVLVRGE